MGHTTRIAGKPPTGKRTKKRAYHHGDLKATMVEAALKLIAKHGPRGFSLAEATRLAGVSVGAPYRHFVDKEALLSAVAAQGFAELWKRIEAVGNTCPDNPRTRLVALGTAYVRFAVERPSHFQVMFDSAVHRRRDPDLDIPAGRCFQMLAETVRQAAVRKDTRTEETLTAAIWALMHGHAMFAMDDSFTNMEFKTSSDTLVHDSFKLLVETPAQARGAVTSCRGMDIHQHWPAITLEWSTNRKLRSESVHPGRNTRLGSKWTAGVRFSAQWKVAPL